MLYNLCLPLMRGLFGLVFLFCGGIKRKNTEILDRFPAGTGVLLCPNHVSDADPAAVYWGLGRPAWYMAKSELFSVPVLGALMRFFQAFPVKRDTADRAALKRAEELLKEGKMVVIFPEGGGNFDNTLQPLHPGALLIAMKTRVPVIPVAMKNTALVWPYGKLKLQRTPQPVEVIFGEPLDLSDLYDKRGATELATQRLTETLAKMLDQPIPQGKPQKHE
jgi:1-acyl-sn-glycerol-3-phosphate acyltransferase